MHAPRTPLAIALLLPLAACGGRDMSIDDEGVARYGAFHYDESAPQGASSGVAAPAGGAVDLAAARAAEAGVAGGGAPVPANAPAMPGPEGGAAKPKKGAKYEPITVEKGGTIKGTLKLTK